MTPKFAALIIGDEILSGKREDKHLTKLISTLGERGLSLAYANYVGDDPDRITQTIAHMAASGDVVFSFGGIGATPDDYTRQCAAKNAPQHARKRRQNNPPRRQVGQRQ
jgi:molybdopterin-biosynthesis enzyme MoeA-like protein